METAITNDGYVVTPAIQLLINTEILLATGETLELPQILKLVDMVKSLTETKE